jgi:hypothetical protein
MVPLPGSLEVTGDSVLFASSRTVEAVLAT